MSTASAERVRRPLRGFALRLAAIAVAALGVRLLYALVVLSDVPASSDGSQFHLLATVIAREGDYLQPFPFLLDGVEIPTAEKPVLFPAYLSLANLLGADSYAAARVACCLLGTATAVVIGLLGRRVGGERVGLLAAGIAAFYPMLVMLDGAVRSESLYALLVALILLFTYRLIDASRGRDAVALGALIGLAALARSEALAFLFVLALPVVWRAAAGRARLRLIATALLAFLVVIAPYQVRNLTTFNRPVVLSTNEGGLLAGANCDAAYRGPSIGSWPCFTALPATERFDESDISWLLRRRALRYARDHAGRLPAVMAVRVLRTWELWDVRDQAALEAGISERDLHVQQIGVVCLWLLGPLAIAGAVLLRRRRVTLWPLLVPILLVTVVSALTWGTSRFRAAADVPIVVLAAVAAAHVVERRMSARAAEHP